MREIKFRLWDKSRNRWIGNNSSHMLALHDTTHGFTELMQFTGLKDKNGKEIYEGDVIRLSYDDEDSCCGKIITEDFLVSWVNKKGCFILSDEKYHPMGTHQGGYPLDYMPTAGREVIGNIYENPTLIDRQTDKGGEVT